MVGVLILIIAFAQLGATCQLLLVPSDPVLLVFLQVAGLGAVFGGLAVLYWKMPPSEAEDEEEETVSVPENKPPTKMEE